MSNTQRSLNKAAIKTGILLNYLIAESVKYLASPIGIAQTSREDGNELIENLSKVQQLAETYFLYQSQPEIFDATFDDELKAVEYWMNKARPEQFIKITADLWISLDEYLKDQKALSISTKKLMSCEV